MYVCMAHAPASHSACHDHKKSPAYLLVWVWGSTFAAFGRKGVPLQISVISNFHTVLPMLQASSVQGSHVIELLSILKNKQTNKPSNQVGFGGILALLRVTCHVV